MQHPYVDSRKTHPNNNCEYVVKSFLLITLINEEIGLNETNLTFEIKLITFSDFS